MYFMTSLKKTIIYTTILCAMVFGIFIVIHTAEALTYIPSDDGIGYCCSSNLSRINDGDISTDGVNDYQIHPQGAVGKTITMTFPLAVRIQNVVFYNRTSCCQDRIGGAQMIFKDVDDEVLYTYTFPLTGNGDIITITPPGGLLNGVISVDLTNFQDHYQNFREIEFNGSVITGKFVPTNNQTILDAIEPIIHSGAAAQTLLGPLNLGNLAAITEINNSGGHNYTLPNLFVKSVPAYPRPAFFAGSLALDVNSIFTALQDAWFGNKVFVGFGEDTYCTDFDCGQSDRKITGLPRIPEWKPQEINAEGVVSGSIPSDLTLPIQQLNVRGNILATNLSTTEDRNVSGQGNVCVDANGTLLMCPAKDPVVDLRFDECSYNGTSGEVVDETGTVTNIAATGGLQTTSLGRIGRSLDFQGVGGAYITGTDNNLFDVSLNEKMTVSTWLRSSADPASGDNYIAWKNASCLGWFMRTNVDGSILSGINIGNSCTDYTNRQISTGPGVIDGGDWHHLVFTIDRVNHQISQYVDGNKVGTVSLPATGNSAVSSSINIGTQWDGAVAFKNGSIDEFKIYRDILSDSEVQELYITENTTTRSIACS